MEHAEHVALLRRGIPAQGGVWADFGAGEGAFTLALADLIGPTGTIYVIDAEARALRANQKAMAQHFPAVTTHYLTADFTQPLTLPPLDGLVIANALHFVPHHAQPATLALLKGYLQPTGRFLVVEYDTDQGNRWVPYPFSYAIWAEMALKAGFTHTEHLHRRGSRFLDAIYSAASWMDERDNA